MKRKSRTQSTGFTLVEIALAIGILAFACMPMVALLPSGAGNFRGAMNLVVTTQIAQRVINDCQQADFDLLVDRQHLPKNESLAGLTFRAPLMLEPAVRYFDEQGTEIIPQDPKALSAIERRRVIYEVNTRIQPQMAVPAAPQLAPTTGNADPQANLALITVQVAFTAGYRDLPISSASPNDATAPDRNLFQPPAGVQVYTYSACVGRGL
jgi:uncharacterized protein (TIGR02598 family)